MLSRFISKPSHFRLLTLISSKSQSHSNPYTFHSPLNPNSTTLLELSRFFSSNHNNNNNNDQSTSSAWKFSRENDGKSEPFFTEDAGDLAGITDFDAGELKAEGRGGIENEAWTRESGEHGGNIFDGIEAESVAKSGGGGVDDWLTGEGEFKPWSLAEEEKAGGDVFDFGDVGVQEFGGVEGESVEEVDRREQMMKLEKEESALTAVIKGPNRAFGDLIAASGITDKMLDSLIALKDLDEVDGLPPLAVIEDMRYEKNTRKSTRADIERQKQEEVAKARVRQVDDKGRAYGTGRRKCSIARVFIQPGEGKFVVNDKEFDVYFPMLDHRAALLRPFAETKTLGLWDIDCTVKGGGVSGQVGAIRLGISKALQNWEPGLRPALRDAGFLTRDPRVVERKKPGKAKARKSFQWVKR